MKLPTREQVLKSTISWTVVAILATIISSGIALFILGDHHKGGGTTCIAKPCFAKLSSRIDSIERELAARTKNRYTSEDATTDKRAIYDAIRTERFLRDAQVSAILRAIGDMHSEVLPDVKAPTTVVLTPQKADVYESKWLWFCIGMAPGMLLGMFISAMFAGGSRGQGKS